MLKLAERAEIVVNAHKRRLPKEKALFTSEKPSKSGLGQSNFAERK
ncbi:hypothetical protein QWY15_06385 [Planococcus sp. N064]|uniref:Uncharacterized protein n=1 Tax=Planococcus liqunii TaxID=3058394 RepID=A0ABT8MPU8_9BACL|nr:hypothetical protein [Planococcus sp. N064]MDN7226924.1 hypothetical protein [Planococcus sp. N064]